MARAPQITGWGVTLCIMGMLNIYDWNPEVHKPFGEILGFRRMWRISTPVRQRDTCSLLILSRVAILGVKNHL